MVVSSLLVEVGRDKWWPVRGHTEIRTSCSQGSAGKVPKVRWDDEDRGKLAAIKSQGSEQESSQ